MWQGASLARWGRLAVLAGIGLCGCRAQRIVTSDFAAVSNDVARAVRYNVATEATVAPVVELLAGEQPVDVYVDWALLHNPEVQAARYRLEAAAMRVPQAASLEDPMVSANGYPIVSNAQQTAAGRMTVDTMLSQRFPWRGKLATRAEAAEAEANMARAQLAAAELATVEKVKRAYYELYYVQQAARVLRQDRRLVSDLADIAESKYRAATASQQDVLRARLELLEIDNRLIALEQETASARARLARVLHVSPETPLSASTALSRRTIPDDLMRLYEQAVSARPELHEQLASLRRDMSRVDLARLEYFPDVTLSAGWGLMTRDRALSPVADGLDNISFGLSANVPLYRRRLSAGVREAEAEAVATARQYDTARDETIEQVKDLFAQAHSQQAMLVLLNERILPAARQTLDVSVPGYRAGEIDFLQLLENWRQVLRYETDAYRLESQLHQTLATLERVVGGSLGVATPQPELIPAAPQRAADRDEATAP